MMLPLSLKQIIKCILQKIKLESLRSFTTVRALFTDYIDSQFQPYVKMII